MALVDALQMAAIARHRTHALVVVGQSAGNGQLAAAAFAFGLLGRGRDFRGAGLAGAALLAALAFFFFIFQTAARSFGGFRGLGLGFEAAGSAA